MKQASLVSLLWWWFFFFLFGAQLAVGVVAAAAAAAESNDVVAVLGLGGMGMAVLRCLSAASSSGSSSSKGAAPVVHAWNRGQGKRQQAQQELDDGAVVIHETAQGAVDAANVILVLIDDWDGIVALLSDPLAIDNKTVVIFSTYTPTDIAALHLGGSGGTLVVGGAVVGVPQTICTDRATILLSHDVPAIAGIGTSVVLPGNHAGTAALANMALIQVITFGVAGQELAYLMLRAYFETKIPDERTAASDFYSVYSRISSEIGPAYTGMLLPSVSRAVVTGDYGKSYVPCGVFRKVLKMHVAFLEGTLGLSGTFLNAYLASLDRVPNGGDGPVAWIETMLPPRKITDEL
jgi:hypothetical protein